MKFIIFADKSYNYIKPLATGLHDTLKDMGHESEIWYDGIYWLYKLNMLKLLIGDLYRLMQNIRYRNRRLYIMRFFNLLTFYSQRKRKLLQNCDCIIVVLNCPIAFFNIQRLDYLRKKYKKPIVNYDFHYLPNQGWWSRIQQMPNYRGLEQFDWYLPVGLVTEYAIPKAIPQIYNCIGMDINSADLYPEQKEFIVLLDFPRPGHEEQRMKEKCTLEEIGMKYIELNGRYTTNQIRSIYRSISIYVVSSRESFGLPIIELQLCGAKIMTPHKEWVPAHYLGKSPFEKGSGEIGSNFIIYHDEQEFKDILLAESKNMDYSANLKKFKDEYALYNHIERRELGEFIDAVGSGAISDKTHLKHKQYNKFISVDDDYETSDIN